MEKSRIRDSVSGINIPDPQHFPTLVLSLFFKEPYSKLRFFISLSSLITVHFISCSLGKIKAHKFVLSLVSDVFRAQFSPRFSDSNQGKMPPNLLPVQARYRLSLLTNSARVVRVQMRGEGGNCGVSADGYSCAHHVTWSLNKVWRSMYLNI